MVPWRGMHLGAGIVAAAFYGQHFALADLVWNTAVPLRRPWDVAFEGGGGGALGAWLF